jgi:Fe-S-cluster containining protein
MNWPDIDAYIAGELRGQPVECRKGCAWCCHQLVVLTHWDDGRQILRAARERMTADEFTVFVAQLRAQSGAISELGHEAAEARRWPCPLLKAGECTVYDVRPVACRSVFSPDADTCRAMMASDDFDALTSEQQRTATAIGERAFRLQIAVNDQRPVDGPVELRELLLRLIDAGE